MNLESKSEIGSGDTAAIPSAVTETNAVLSILIVASGIACGVVVGWLASLLLGWVQFLC